MVDVEFANGASIPTSTHLQLPVFLPPCSCWAQLLGCTEIQCAMCVCFELGTMSPMSTGLKMETLKLRTDEVQICASARLSLQLRASLPPVAIAGVWIGGRKKIQNTAKLKGTQFSRYCHSRAALHVYAVALASYMRTGKMSSCVSSTSWQRAASEGGWG